MKQEEFIKVLEEKGCLYKIEGDKIIVTQKNWTVNLDSLTSLPTGVVFSNKFDVLLGSLTSLPPGVEFKNGDRVWLQSLKSLPPGVEFKNEGDVNLNALIGGWFNDWEGNIDGVKSKRLLNLMIKRGMFI